MLLLTSESGLFDTDAMAMTMNQAQCGRASSGVALLGGVGEADIDEDVSIFGFRFRVAFGVAPPTLLPSRIRKGRSKPTRC